MRKIVFVAALMVSSPAFAADFEAVAFERLAYELSTASTTTSRVESVSAYVEALDRVGVAPKSSRGCLLGALSGSASSLCKSAKIEARSGGAGTGGAD